MTVGFVVWGFSLNLHHLFSNSKAKVLRGISHTGNHMNVITQQHF